MTTYADFFAALPPSSGSPRGLSHYAKIYECAWHAAQPPVQLAVEQLETEKRGAMRGAYYHALWQHRPSVSGPGELTDVQATAVRLYEGYAKAFCTPWERFGCSVVAFEKDFDFGWITGRADLLLRVVDPHRLEAHGVLLPTGALLIHDFKTSDSAKKAHYYVNGLQGRFYPSVWNASPEAEQCRGILFDEVVEHATLRIVRDKKGGSSFNTHWSATPLDQPARMAALRAWVDNAAELATRGARNEASCIDSWGTQCALYHTCHGA